MLANTDSPVARLVAHVPKVGRNIAPEREHLFDEATSALSIEVLDAGAWVFRYREDGVIEISTRALEVLWSASHAYFSVYARIASEKVSSGGEHVVLDLQADPELKPAADLLRWATEEILDGGTGRPFPIAALSTLTPEDANLVDELALCAIGLLLHHEIAHWRLKHYAEEVELRLDQEREADREATQWILGGLPTDDARFRKRALGVVVALVLLTALPIHAGIHGGKSHPRPYDRLFNALDAFIGDDENHVAWAFACAGLKLHLDNAPIPPPTGPAGGYSDFRAAVSAYVDALAELDEHAAVR